MFTKHFFNALSYHPDRLSQRYTSHEALWVAPSAIMIETSIREILKQVQDDAFNILLRKTSYDASSFICLQIMFRTYFFLAICYLLNLVLV
jgi:hypothetical protein